MMQKMGPVPASRVLPLCLQVAKALAYAHAQEVYHGLLDATFMRVSAAGTVKITGFDYLRIQRFVDAQIKLPEPSTDIALFGKLLYEFLTGSPISLSEPPQNPMTYYPHIPTELVELTQKLIHPKESGLHSMAEVYQKLEGIAQTVTKRNPAPSPDSH